MKEYCLNIAGSAIVFESAGAGSHLTVSERCSGFMDSSSGVPDILIGVHSRSFSLPREAVKVFSAPAADGINGIGIMHSPDFWSIWKHNRHIFITTRLPLGNRSNAVLIIPMSGAVWELYVDSGGQPIDPFAYPLDGLILYYLTVIMGGILIHASGVNLNGAGYLFCGRSGRGKTTMARLWESCGATVIHDDRLIVRHTEAGYTMFNTPVYSGETPRLSPLGTIYAIEHGHTNTASALNGAAAATAVMANCIQHNWSAEIIAGTLSTVYALCESVCVKHLAFVPEKETVKYITGNG
ncbi:MAG: hypothetical protein LBV26_07210 [Bacteroidales bacterium]|nr:hypothetical protein [Bacteroidales bacterium]